MKTKKPAITTYIEGTQRGYAVGLRGRDGKIIIESHIRWNGDRTLGEAYRTAAATQDRLDAALADMIADLEEGGDR